MADTEHTSPDEASDETPEETGGSSAAEEPSAEEVEQEREERLDPDNRPDGAEVDNTQRDFDAEKGAFTDSDEYDDLEPRFVAEEETGSGGEESERA